MNKQTKQLVRVSCDSTGKETSVVLLLFFLLLLFLIGQNDDRENPVEGALPRSPGQAEAGGESAPSAIKAASAKERRRNEESPGSLPVLTFE